MVFFFETTAANILVTLFLCVYFLFRRSMKVYNFWTSRSVPQKSPIPLFGNSFKTTFSIKPVSQVQIERYNFFKDHRFGGIYAFRKPILFVKDPDLIEHILIRDFSVFYNRGFKFDGKLDPLSNHLLNLEDSKWKNLRNKLTPAFSSGKLKAMHQQLQECSETLVDYLKVYENNEEPLEIKQEISKYTIDVIGSCAFGLSLNTFKEKNSEFRKMSEQIFKPTFLSRLRFALRSQFPRLLRLFQWKILPKRFENFFISVVKSTIEYREKNGIQRKDFLHQLMELRKRDMENPNREEDLMFDEQLMTANAFVFFVAGFDTTSATLSFLLYELALHPDIQEKVYNEIETQLERSGVFSYESITGMTYLDRAISETLRKYPPLGAVTREAKVPYTIPDTSITIPKGTMVYIPTYALQHDPKYFPDPEKFDPDRFEQGKEITKGTYLPFGDGPRICIGYRFAQLEIKYAIANLLHKYRVTVNGRTKNHLEFNCKTLFLSVKGGLWLNLHSRE